MPLRKIESLLLDTNSDNAFTVLTDLIPHQVWTATPDGLLDFFNKQWYAYSQWTYEQSKGQGWAAAIHPDDLPYLASAWEDSLKHHLPYQVNARVLGADQAYRWFMIKAWPIKKESGEIFKWVGTNTDINEQKLLEDKLNQIASELEEKVEQRTQALQLSQLEVKIQRDRLKRFFMQIPAGICILDGPDLIFELVNSSYQNLFPGRELLGKTMIDGLPELKGQPIHDILNKVYQTGETFEGKELLVPLARTHNGPLEDLYFNFIYQARRNEHGEIDGILAFVFDVTSITTTKKELEKSQHLLQEISEELATSNEELQAANEEIITNNEELSLTNEKLVRINTDLDNFIYTASHDLKAPISNIEGLIDALKDNLDQSIAKDELILNILGFIDASVERFKKTILDLTDVTRIHKDNENEPSLISVEETVEEVLLDLAPMITQSGTQLSVEINNCPSIVSSRRNLRSIVYNLISNGIKYKHPDRKPVIVLSCDERNGYHELAVTDNGLGIDMAKEKKLFEMFSRLHNHVEGTGVGLYMVKRMVENMGGRIEVKSTLEIGSTFTIYFKVGINIK